MLALPERKAGIDVAIAGLSTHRRHALAIGSERAIAEVRIGDGTGTPGIVTGHTRAGGRDDKQSGKCEE